MIRIEASKGRRRHIVGRTADATSADAKRLIAAQKAAGWKVTLVDECAPAIPQQRTVRGAVAA